MASGGSNVHSLPKWKVALAIGGVAALGLGAALYYKSRSQANSSTKDDDDSSSKSKVTEENTEPVPQSELEKAKAAKDKGNKYFKGGKYDQAIKCYSEAIELCPSHHKEDIAPFFQNRAAAYEQLKNFDEVIKDCTQALEYNKKYVKAIYRRARALEHEGKLGESLEDITAVCILEGFQNQQSLVMADRVLKALGKKRSQAEYKNRSPVMPSKYFVKAYFSAFANDPIMNTLGDDPKKDSDQEKDNDLDKNSEDAGSQSIIENTGDDLDKEDEAEKYRDESPEKGSRSGEQTQQSSGPFETAKQYLSNQEYEDIIELCTKEIESEDAQYIAEAYLLRGTFHIFLGLGHNALEDFNTLIDMPEIDKRVKSNALIKRGSLKIQVGDQTGSLEDFATAVRIDPENSDIYHHRGQVDLLLDRVDDAVKDFEKSVTLNGDFAIAQIQKCYTEYRAAMIVRSPLQLGEAMKSFQTVLKKFPDCAEGYVLYAQAQADQYAYEEANTYFNKALELEPDNANVWVHKGTLHIQWKQDFKEAMKLINKALEVDDKCEFAYEMLGTLEVQMGDIDKALDHFNKAIKLAKTEIELAHLFSLYDAASAQVKVAKNFGVTLAPGIPTS